MIQITLLTTSNCALCSHAKEVLDRVAQDHPIDLDVVGLDSAAGQALAARSGMAFPPGVLIDGAPFAYGRLSERKLRRALSRR